MAAASSARAFLASKADSSSTAMSAGKVPAKKLSRFWCWSDSFRGMTTAVWKGLVCSSAFAASLLLESRAASEKASAWQKSGGFAKAKVQNQGWPQLGSLGALVFSGLLRGQPLQATGRKKPLGAC